jgi:hypothetical protein
MGVFLNLRSWRTSCKRRGRSSSMLPFLFRKDLSRVHWHRRKHEVSPAKLVEKIREIRRSAVIAAPTNP